MYCPVFERRYILHLTISNPQENFLNCVYSLFQKINSAFQPINENPETIQVDTDDIITRRILKIYGNHILRLSYSYLHNMSDAEDVLQDTLIAFITKKPNLYSIEHEKAWLFRVAINLSKNKIGYNKIRQTDELEANLIAMEREDLSFLWAAVKALPVKYRQCIHLYYYEGYSTQQVSEILQIKDSTIRSLLKRGREKLKTILKEDFDFEE